MKAPLGFSTAPLTLRKGPCIEIYRGVKIGIGRGWRDGSDITQSVSCSSRSGVVLSAFTLGVVHNQL